MTKKEALQVKIAMSKEKEVEITGFRKQGKSYAIEAVDLRNGYPFVVWSTEEWMDRINNK